MSNPFSIFYSWQSDLPSSDNKNLISKALESSSKELSKKLNSKIDYGLVIDRDTKGTSGSPNIANTIFDKIKKADVFLCDVTPINNQFGSTPARLIPNPNVLIELGFAINALGWDRIICVNNLKHGKIEELPFDIRGHRITTYNSDNTDCQKHLSGIFKVAIKSIIDNYDDILSRHNNIGFFQHDKKIYNLLNSVCDEALLNASISAAVNDLYTNRYYTNTWFTLESFYETTMNHFIDKELSNTFLVFVSKLETFHNKCAIKFFYDKTNEESFDNFKINYKHIIAEHDLQLEYNRSIKYIADKEPHTDEEWWETDERVEKLRDELFLLGEEARKAYQNFIHIIKIKLFING